MSVQLTNPPPPPPDYVCSKSNFLCPALSALVFQCSVYLSTLNSFERRVPTCMYISLLWLTVLQVHFACPLSLPAEVSPAHLSHHSTAQAPASSLSWWTLISQNTTTLSMKKSLPSIMTSSNQLRPGSYHSSSQVSWNMKPYKVSQALDQSDQREFVHMKSPWKW